MDAHAKTEDTLKAEVPHREPQADSLRSLGQDDSMSAPLPEAHAKDIETGCPDPVSSASSAAEPGADPEQRGRVASLLLQVD